MAERRVTAMGVVKAFDIIKEHKPRGGSGRGQQAAEALGFEGGKEAFDGGVIVRISPPAHRGTSLGFLQERLKIATGILAAAIRMMEEAWSGRITINGFAPGFQDQGDGEIGAGGPAGDFA